MLHGLGIRTGVDLDELVHVGEWICGVLGRESQSRVGLARAAGLRAAAEASAAREALRLRQQQLQQPQQVGAAAEADARVALEELDRGEKARGVALRWPQLPSELIVGSGLLERSR